MAALPQDPLKASNLLSLVHPLPLTFHFAANCHQKGVIHEPYQTKSRSCCSGAPCARDGVFLGGQPFLVEREYQFSAPRAPFFSHDHRSSSSARRILQRPFLPSLSEAHEEPADGAGIPLSLLLYLHGIHE